jgi:hypothetical protein
MIQTKCDQCGKYFDVDPNNMDQFYLRSMNSDADSTRLCSVSCLCERAWELRERQPKLSKSKQ